MATEFQKITRERNWDSFLLKGFKCTFLRLVNKYCPANYSIASCLISNIEQGMERKRQEDNCEFKAWRKRK